MQKPTRLPGLDLLRALAIGWVMLYHLDGRYGVTLPAFARYGYMGVDLFFVLSGYLIGWQLLKPYTRGAEPLWGQFFQRRAWRVLPAYLAVLALYVLVPASGESASMAPLWQFLTFTTNLFPDYFRSTGFSHAWSLCVEEHFYLLLPPVVWLLARKPRAHVVAALAIAIFAGGMLLRAWLWQSEVAPYMHVRSGEDAFILHWIESIYNPTYARLDGLLMGVMLAVVKGFRPAWWERAMARAPLLLVAGAGGVYASTGIDFTSHAGSVFGYPALSVSLALLVMGAASPHTWLGRVPVPGAAPIAAMAFSLYLTHKQVYHWISNHWRPVPEGPDWLAFCVYNGAALAAGALLYLAIERPGMRLRDRFGRRRQAGLLPGATM